MAFGKSRVLMGESDHPLICGKFGIECSFKLLTLHPNDSDRLDHGRFCMKNFKTKIVTFKTIVGSLMHRKTAPAMESLWRKIF